MDPVGPLQATDRFAGKIIDARTGHDVPLSQLCDLLPLFESVAIGRSSTCVSPGIVCMSDAGPFVVNGRGCQSAFQF